MPERCSAKFQDDQLAVEPICVGCDGFVPDRFSRRSGGKAPKQMWKTVPRLEMPAKSAGARPSSPPPVVDGHGRMFGGNWQAVEAVKKITKWEEINRANEGFLEEINRKNENLPDLSEVGAQGFFDEW